jgi:hypothetical protein
VLSRLVGAFQGSDYDIRGLFRILLNTECYQRQFRLGVSPEEHLAFQAASPSRMLPDALWNTLDTLLIESDLVNGKCCGFRTIGT